MSRQGGKQGKDLSHLCPPFIAAAEIQLSLNELRGRASWKEKKEKAIMGPNQSNISQWRLKVWLDRGWRRQTLLK